jgi:hypothetical protein
MAKKKTKKEAPVAKAQEQEPIILEERHEAIVMGGGVGIDSQKAENGPPASIRDVPAQEAPKPDKGSFLKLVAIGALLVVVLSLAYYFLMMSDYSFATGTPVDMETFKGIFLESEKAYIVMDVRGQSDYHVSDNVMQCGVDFASSSGMGGKTVTPLSIGDNECIGPTGKRDFKECFTGLKDGITVYVRGGTSDSVSYYTTAWS